LLFPTLTLSAGVGKRLSEEMFSMTPTIIVKCTKCGGLMLTTKGQKTKTCPYCGAHINLLKAQKVAAATNSFEASNLLRKLKSEEGFSSKP
jgi:hypothetical protein